MFDISIDNNSQDYSANISDNNGIINLTVSPEQLAGKSPYIGDNGNWFEYIGTSFVDTGIKAQGDQGIQGLQGIQGMQGEKGDQGIQGIAGYTPIKGIDYYTDLEKTEIINTVINEVNSMIGLSLDSLNGEVV